MTEKNENSGETPVVRPLTDVPREVLDELTEAFENRGGQGNRIEESAAADDVAPPREADDVVVIDGFDLVADDELTRARKPPLVIDDTELTGPVARPGDETFADDDSVVRGARRFRLRRIAVRRAEGKRRLRIALWVVWSVLPVAGSGIRWCWRLQREVFSERAGAGGWSVATGAGGAQGSGDDIGGDPSRLGSAVSDVWWRADV